MGNMKVFEDFARALVPFNLIAHAMNPDLPVQFSPFHRPDLGIIILEAIRDGIDDPMPPPHVKKAIDSIVVGLRDAVEAMKRGGGQFRVPPDHIATFNEWAFAAEKRARDNADLGLGHQN